MLIDTAKGDGVVQKEVQVGGGVIIEVPGTRWRVNAEVVAVAPDGQSLSVKGADFEGWIPKEQVKDVLSPGAFPIDNAINVLTNTDDLE
jgi:hypothetical protein